MGLMCITIFFFFFITGDTSSHQSDQPSIFELELIIKVHSSHFC